MIAGQITGVNYTTQDPGTAPINNRCVNAIGLNIGQTITASLSGALFDFSNQAVCGARSDRPAGKFWL